MSAPKIATVVKARLRNFGNGILEVGDDAVRFYVETGRFKKQRKISREIQLNEVEGVERQGNDLTITWKDTMDMFVIEQPSQVDAIYERINTNLAERRKKVENKNIVLQAQTDLTQTTNNAMETVYSLFSLLEQLHGRVNWKDMETNYKMVEENTAKLANQNINPINLDITQLQLAAQEHRPKEIAEETHDALKSLYNYFDELSSNQALEEPHPNKHDIKLIIQAIYILNDMALGVIVGDESIEKEANEFIKVLDELAKLPGLRVDVTSVKSSLDKLFATKGKQTEGFDEIRLKIKQQLKELMTLQQSTNNQSTSTTQSS